MNFTPRRAEIPTASPREVYNKLEKYMATELVTLGPDLSITKAMELLLKHQISGATVLDENRKIVGMLTEKDCLRVLIDSAYNNMPYRDRKVRDYMTDEVRTVSLEQDLIDVAYEFLNSNFRRFPVVHNGRLVGQVSRRDVLRAALDIKRTTWDKAGKR